MVVRRSSFFRIDDSFLFMLTRRSFAEGSFSSPYLMRFKRFICCWLVVANSFIFNGANLTFIPMCQPHGWSNQASTPRLCLTLLKKERVLPTLWAQLLFCLACGDISNVHHNLEPENNDIMSWGNATVISFSCTVQRCFVSFSLWLSLAMGCHCMMSHSWIWTPPRLGQS